MSAVEGSFQAPYTSICLPCSPAPCLVACLRLPACTHQITARRDSMRAAQQLHQLVASRHLRCNNSPVPCQLQQHRTARRQRAAAPATSPAAASAKAISVANPEGGEPYPITVQVPSGAELYQVALKKPLGFTLAEKPGVGIVVDELQSGGHAQQGGIAVGDVLLAVTARAQEPGSSSLKLVLLPTQGQSFKTVAAGLRSNTCAQCAIVLLLQRQKS